jgi:hypothetical protein
MDTIKNAINGFILPHVIIKMSPVIHKKIIRKVIGNF